jgi:RluA family pseudouridine synthase
VHEGDRIDYVDPQHQLPKEYPLELEIVFQDEFLAAVNKPSGIVVSGNLHRTLENAVVNLIEKSSEQDALKWAKPVHRLDASTSGMVLFAKTAETHRRLSNLFEEKQIQKTYRAIVQGKVEDQVITLPIETKASESGLKSIRCVNSLQNEDLSLVELSPKTGRTHQLRIHCASINAPMVGDKIYGEKGNIMNHKGLFLAAVRLEFLHPMTSEALSISIPQPPKFDALLEREERRWKMFNKE